MAMIKKGGPITFTQLGLYIFPTMVLSIICLGIPYVIWNDASPKDSPVTWIAYAVAMLVSSLTAGSLIQIFAEVWIPVFRVIKTALHRGL